MVNNIELDEQINKLETQLKALRAQKEQESDVRNNKNYAKVLEKFRKQYEELQSKYCDKAELFRISLTLEFEIHNTFNIFSGADSYFGVVNLIESDNPKLGQAIANTLYNDCGHLDDVIGNNAREFTKEVSKFMKALNNCKFSDEISDDIYALIDND